MFAIWLILFALRAVMLIVIAGAVLTLVRDFARPPWVKHPLVRSLIALSLAICAPFRLLLKQIGIPPRPIDFSPALAVTVLEIALRLIRWIF